MDNIQDIEESKVEQLSTKVERRSFSETRQELTDIINRAYYAKESFVVQKNGKDMAAVVPLKVLEELQNLKEEKRALEIAQRDATVAEKSESKEEFP